MIATDAAHERRALGSPSAVSMQWPFIVSMIFHAAVVIALTVGLPHVHKEPLNITPISIELVDIDEVTQTNKIAPTEKDGERKEGAAQAQARIQSRHRPKVTSRKATRI